MHMLKPSFRTDSSLKDKKTLDSTSRTKASFQQNTSGMTTTYKPQSKNFTHGIGLSLKSIENRQLPVSIFQPVDSQQNLDLYLQKVIKSNLEKMSQLRMEHEKQKIELLREIKTLKSENTQLKSRLDQQTSSSEIQKQGKARQLPSSLQKRIITKYGTQKALSPNPERTPQKKALFEEMKEKTDKLLLQIEEFKKRNAILSVQKRTLTSSIQRLQKQVHQKNNQLQQYRKQQFELNLQLKDTKHHMDHLRRQYEADRHTLEKQIERIKLLKQKGKQKEKEKQKQKITSIYVMNQQISPRILNDPRITGFVDKRVVKHLECQLKERDSQLHLKDHLIGDLNDKILSSGISALNAKYKYMIKA